MRAVAGVLFFLALLVGAVALVVWGGGAAVLPSGLRSGLVAFLEEPDRAGEEEGEAGEEAEEAGPQRVVFRDGHVALKLSASMQKRTALRTRTLGSEERRLEETAFGRVVDLGPLMETRGRYHRLRSELATARVQREHAARQYERLEALHGQRANVSEREIQKAEARLEEARTRVGGLRRRIGDLRSAAGQQWGETLVAWALGGESEAFRDLAEGRRRLVLLTLAPGHGLPTGVEAVFLDPDGNRQQARRAQLVGPAPEVDPALQGRTYYFLTPASGLRTGMRIQAWVPQTGTRVEGVRVPARSVVWHGGTPWAYERTEPELFVRRALRGEPQGGSWFVREGLESGDRIVTAGAGMLLSEELRAQIPEEDEGP